MSEFNHESYWPEFQKWAEGQNSVSILQAIEKLQSPAERIALARFTVRCLMFREWKNKNLDLIIPLGDYANEQALQIGDQEEANVNCYNMSANLADCWNDGFQRTNFHFEKGLAYAEQALKFRKELNKGPIPFSIAYWAQGIHQLLLGRIQESEESFNLSLKYAMEAEGTLSAEISKDLKFNVLISHGYLALAHIALKKEGSQTVLNKVIAAFEERKKISLEDKEDSELGISQLQYIKEKLHQPTRPS